MNDTRNISTERLAAVLDAYGADDRRWPEAERGRLLRLVADDAEAARLLRQAQALDRLLALADAAPAMPEEGLEPLAGRILADFAVAVPARESGESAGGGQVIAFPGSGARSQRLPRRQRGWMAAALAACFACGLYLGAIGLGGWTLDPAGSVVDLAVDETQVATADELFASDAIIDEDLL